MRLTHVLQATLCRTDQLFATDWDTTTRRDKFSEYEECGQSHNFYYELSEILFMTNLDPTTLICAQFLRLTLRRKLDSMCKFLLISLVVDCRKS